MAEPLIARSASVPTEESVETPVQTAVSQRSPLAESAVLRRPAGDFASLRGIIRLDIPAQMILDQQTIDIFPSKSSSDTWETSSPRAGVRPEQAGCDWPDGSGMFRAAFRCSVVPFDFWLRVSKGRRAGRTFQRCGDKEAL